MNTATSTRDYHITVSTAVSPAETFAAIADVPGWWAKKFEGSARKKGDTFTVRFGETFVDFLISDLIRDQRSVWRVTDCHLHWISDKKEWKGTEIVWEVSSVDGMTRVDMTHIGLRPQVECFDSCETGWNHHIKDSLLKLIVEKKGLPE